LEIENGLVKNIENTLNNKSGVNKSFVDNLNNLLVSNIEFTQPIKYNAK
jgi:hypothetical protein